MNDSAKNSDKNIVWHTHQVNIDKRTALLKQSPKVLWFTGLSGSGKSTIAGQVELALHQKGHATYLLDGDNVRYGLCSDLGFSENDRKENIRRVGEVAKLMFDAGLIVLCAFVSPSQEARKKVRDLFPDDAFIEIYVDTPLEICIERDPKALYKKAQSGEIKDFTGLQQGYEAPQSPEVHINGQADLESAIQLCLQSVSPH